MICTPPSPAPEARPRIGRARCPLTSAPWTGKDRQDRIVARALNAAKLRVWRGCRGCRAGRCAECVGAESGAGEEAEAGPFSELGEHVAGLDVELQGEFVAVPWPRGLAGHDGGDELPRGGWRGCSGCGRVRRCPGAGCAW